MNYGLNNNTGRPTSQANNGFQSVKNGINNAKTGLNFLNGMKSDSGFERLMSIANLFTGGK